MGWLACVTVFVHLNLRPLQTVTYASVPVRHLLGCHSVCAGLPVNGPVGSWQGSLSVMSEIVVFAVGTHVEGAG